MKFSRRFFHTLGMLVALAVLVWAIGSVQNRMNRMRRDHRLTDNTEITDAPPVVAFTTMALGGFRGLIADFLFLRSWRLQEESSYFEMVQLASWIVKLQPKFTGAAAWLAWNMAYNISVTLSDFEDRWQWVQRGVELLRDEALVYNPGDPRLFFELAWIYQHKMGHELDNAQKYYKSRLAVLVTNVVGEYPPDWRAIHAGAANRSELAERIGDDHPFWEWLDGSGMSFAELEEEFRGNAALPEDLAEVLADEADRAEVETCLRRRWLELGLRLDAAYIANLNDRYGELDWRLPEAHAIYWASRGLDADDERMDTFCNRVIFQSLANAFEMGRVVMLAEANYMELVPNISLVDAVRDVYLENIEMQSAAGSEAIHGTTTGYENFLTDAVVNLFMYGRNERAQEYLKLARETFPHRDYFRKPLEEFALYELGGDLAQATQGQARGLVNAYLMQSCSSLAAGEHERARMLEIMAVRIHAKYGEFIGSREIDQLRRALPPIRSMKRTVVEQCLTEFPEGLAKRLRAELQQQTGRLDLGLGDDDDEGEDGDRL